MLMTVLFLLLILIDPIIIGCSDTLYYLSGQKKFGNDLPRKVKVLLTREEVSI